MSAGTAMTPDGSIVAHVLVVGFHAQLGNRIEFAYPRLRGDTVLRSPKLSDTSDISSPGSTPPPPLPSSSLTPSSLTPSSLTPSSSSTSAPWGVLPPEWSHLPFLALPDGAHDREQDLVFFVLPGAVHCVACFRQSASRHAKTVSASTADAATAVAARGSVQKSVVLLARRPWYGVLADRLVPAVRAYFEQKDFASTAVLAALFHSLNLSLARPSLAHSDTLFHGLDFRALLRKLGPQVLAVLKLILLERRVVIFSHPVHLASNAVLALASVFHGALDSLTDAHSRTSAHAPAPLDTHPSHTPLGLPLSLFGPRDRVLLQPYAPLPLLAQLLPEDDVSDDTLENYDLSYNDGAHDHDSRHHRSRRPRRACLIGTSHNVGLLLSSTAAQAAAARKVAGATATAGNTPSSSGPTLSSSALLPTVTPPRSRPPLSHPSSSQRLPLQFSASAPAFVTPPASRPGPDSFVDTGPDNGTDNDLPNASAATTADTTNSNNDDQQLDSMSLTPAHGKSGQPPMYASGQSRDSRNTRRRRRRNPVPVVDALVNLSTGKVSVSGALEPLCRITRQERRFMRDLMVSAANSSASVSASGGATGTFMGSDDYIRSRLREYLVSFLQSVSSVDGVLGGPVGGETWSAEMVDDFDFSAFDPYNELFVTTWMTTRNAAQWARRCTAVRNAFAPPPKPLLNDSVIDDAFGSVDRVADSLSGFRQNVASLGRFSSFVSNRAVQGLSSLFRRIEQEVARMDTAVGIANHTEPDPTTTPPSQIRNSKNGTRLEPKLNKSAPQ